MTNLTTKLTNVYVLHGRLPKFVTIVKTTILQPSTVDHTSFDTLGDYAIFNEFLKWYDDRQNPSSTAVAHSGTSFVGLTHSTTLGPWILDSSVIAHITGNSNAQLTNIFTKPL